MLHPIMNHVIDYTLPMDDGGALDNTLVNFHMDSNTVSYPAGQVRMLTAI